MRSGNTIQGVAGTSLKVFAFLIILCACQQKEEISMRKDLFGKLGDGREVYLYTVKNTNGLELKVTNFGASVVSLKVPDRSGTLEHVILGYPRLEEYVRLRHFFGAIVGRWGNRIAKGKFTLGDQEYALAVNEGENHLHGGIKGFDRVLWDTEEKTTNNDPEIILSYLSKDGEEGYPGNLFVSVTYSLTSQNELKIDYSIKTDKLTIKNVTNHSYFNLSGNAKSDIMNHRLMLNADHFLPVKKGLIPTGEIWTVEDTPMDFREPRRIGSRIGEDYEQLSLGLGYDHNWIINGSKEKLKYAGFVYEPVSGRRMDIHTTEPGIQFYSGNFMDGTDIGFEGIPYKYRYAMCLETQHYPDSPNHPKFPSTELRPGEIYTSTTIFTFSVK
jgi:aldose 1-epimerase